LLPQRGVNEFNRGQHVGFMLASVNDAAGRILPSNKRGKWGGKEE